MFFIILNGLFQPSTPLRIEGFPELSKPIESMKRGEVVSYVRNVLRYVVPKDHEKVLKIFMNFKILLLAVLRSHYLQSIQFFTHV